MSLVQTVFCYDKRFHVHAVFLLNNHRSQLYQQKGRVNELCMITSFPTLSPPPMNALSALHMTRTNAGGREREQRPPPPPPVHVCSRDTLVTSDPDYPAPSDMLETTLAPYSPGCCEGTGLATVLAPKKSKDASCNWFRDTWLP